MAITYASPSFQCRFVHLAVESHISELFSEHFAVTFK